MASPSRTSALVAACLLLVGQIFLVLVAPLTRAQGTFAEIVGVAILVPDSRSYLDVASQLPERIALPWMRMGYPTILAVADLIGDPLLITVLAQLGALLLAGAALHRALHTSAGGVAALIASSVLLVNPMVAQWGRILVTESLFFAGIVGLMVLGRCLLDTELSRPSALAFGAIALSMPLLRANGIFVLFSALTLVSIARFRGLTRWTTVGGLWLVLLLVLPSFLATVGPPAEGTIAAQLRAGVVIEGTDHVRTTIPMPHDGRAEDESLSGAAAYALGNPVATAHLGIRRVTAEMLQVRRHYPTVVNVAFGIAMFLYLAAAFIGWMDSRGRRWRALVSVLALPLVVVTAATFASPEGRYGWAFLLPLAPLVGIGADRAVKETVGRMERRRRTSPR